MLFCTLLPVHTFSFFTFEVQLFSRHLWVRRTIAMCFSVVTVITVLVLFHYTRWNDKVLWICIAIVVPIMVLFTVFCYYVADKIEKRNLDAINQKLANGNMDTDKK